MSLCFRYRPNHSWISSWSDHRRCFLHRLVRLTKYQESHECCSWEDTRSETRCPKDPRAILLRRSKGHPKPWCFSSEGFSSKASRPSSVFGNERLSAAYSFNASEILEICKFAALISAFFCEPRIRGAIMAIRTAKIDKTIKISNSVIPERFISSPFKKTKELIDAPLINQLNYSCRKPAKAIPTK